ncbi:vacuolar cation/proton exchanger 3 isoform X2 [Amborella trichopoda]|nr:vacuolar cation/proton exchanger 3 isoform X2 [Amborella trichopoda]XP_011620860.1 vacuolar cation/proton exchanger 3 isoform X2 [Amborella trichopoda]XP_020518814.1 vacuolar cation/proton exchanger 3 isoform X2 [Amborella trichopoda]|eukprot:XP_011620859.1 vacuolar cation/proton exchanger 3 isoform X2 [Amborella trichopoda]
MGSIDDRQDCDSEEEILVISSPVIRKSHGSEASSNGPFPIFSHTWISKRSRNRVFTSIYIVLIKAKINLLLPCGPLAILLHYLTGKHGWVFFFSSLGITPLAERLGYATEQLAFYTGPTVGGLLNATFGNATEMIISIYALKQGMIRVVQQSLLGSILSNMLLVLGCAFLSGGLVFCNKDQVFNKAAAVVNSGLLLMAVMGILFPAVLHFTHTEVHFGKSELALSRFSSCIMLFAYVSYLYFQLKSHQNLPNSVNEEDDGHEEDSDDEEVPEITQWETMCWLAILTLWISVLSGYLVDAIQGASESLNVPVAFISVILLPIVGNAAEHASAIMFAMKDKLDITLGVAIGSSTQISMFVIPFCVVVGWCMGKPMDLNFQLFETATLFITVLVVAFMLQEGTANYFKGLMLILCYLIVAASFFVHVDPTSNDD